MSENTTVENTTVENENAEAEKLSHVLSGIEWRLEFFRHKRFEEAEAIAQHISALDELPLCERGRIAWAAFEALFKTMAVYPEGRAGRASTKQRLVACLNELAAAMSEAKSKTTQPLSLKQLG